MYNAGCIFSKAYNIENLPEEFELREDLKNMIDIYKEFGTDSYIGRIASISMSCTETIFYTMSVYFMTAKVKKTRYTLVGALLATLGGLAASVVLAGMMG